jgi:hypothetical protein
MSSDPPSPLETGSKNQCDTELTLPDGVERDMEHTAARSPQEEEHGWIVLPQDLRSDDVLLDPTEPDLGYLVETIQKSDLF